MEDFERTNAIDCDIETPNNFSDKFDVTSVPSLNNAPGSRSWFLLMFECATEQRRKRL